MRLIDAFVAVDASQFVHAFDTAHHQPFEMQFQSNPQRQVDVERVMVRCKRTGCCTAGNTMQRWAFNFNKGLGIERLANRTDDLRAI